MVTMAPEKSAKEMYNIDTSPIGAVLFEDIGMIIGCMIVTALCALNGVDSGKAVAWGLLPLFCALS